ncbi:MAG: hypothetical protein ACTS6A_01170 [Candidatus Hodgkinia cicadicola]
MNNRERSRKLPQTTEVADATRLFRDLTLTTYMRNCLNEQSDERRPQTNEI